MRSVTAGGLLFCLLFPLASRAQLTSRAALDAQVIANTEKLKELDRSQAELAGDTRTLFENYYDLRMQHEVQDEQINEINKKLNIILGLATAVLAAVLSHFTIAFFSVKKGENGRNTTRTP